MAKPSSTARPTSRQGKSVPPSAPPATAPTRTTRSTRSQSHEPVQPSLDQIDASKEDGGDDDDREVVLPTAGGKRGKKAKQHLDTVAEDALEDHLLTAQNQAALIAATDDIDAARRISTHSAMSGTTAKTSFSQEEIDELDPEIMMDSLPRLANSAEDLMKLLLPEDPQKRLVAWKEIRTVGSRHSKLYASRVKALDVHRLNFGSQDYLSPRIVLRALFGVQNIHDVPNGPWRPDTIIYRINLTQMLRHLVTIPSDSAQATQSSYDTLGSLVTYFPTVIAGPDFDPEAVSMCLALQVQLTVARLHAFSSDPIFDALQVIQDTFYDTDDEGDDVYRLFESLHMMNAPSDNLDTLVNSIITLVDELKAPFAPDSGLTLAAALGTLKTRHPWEGFLERVLRYYEHRKAELDGQVVASGGTDRIAQALVGEVQRTQDAKAAEVKRLSLGNLGSTPKKGFGEGAIAALKAREKQLSGQTAPPPMSTSTAGLAETAMVDEQGPQPGRTVPAITPAPTAQMGDLDPQDQPAVLGDEWDGQEDEGVDRQTAQQTARSSLAELSMQVASQFQDMQRQRANADKGKRPAFVDRQANAQRIQFEDSQPSQTRPSGGAEFQIPGRGSAPGPYHVSSGNQAGKRSHDMINDGIQDFEPSQDDGFETDIRDTAAADERRRAAPTSSRPPMAPPSGSGIVDYGFPGSAEASPAKRQRKNPGATIPDLQDPDPDDVEAPTGSNYARAKYLAKRNRIQASQQRPTQTRTPWSEEQETRLEELIAEHGGNGIRYAALKKIDDAEGGENAILWNRDAESLRFKARNMKEQYILSRMPLPLNFDRIVLDKKSIEKIHSRGIEYHQERIRGSGLEGTPGF